MFVIVDIVPPHVIPILSGGRVGCQTSCVASFEASHVRPDGHALISRSRALSGGLANCGVLSQTELFEQSDLCERQLGRLSGHHEEVNARQIALVNASLRNWAPWTQCIVPGSRAVVTDTELHLVQVVCGTCPIAKAIVGKVVFSCH